MARFNPHHDTSKLYPAMRELAAEDAEAILSMATLNVTGPSQRHVLDLTRLINQSLSIPTALHSVLAAQS
ncbi:MAG: hypothetical protein ACK4NW_05810 [Roseinatronobacter sp.]